MPTDATKADHGVAGLDGHRLDAGLLQGDQADDIEVHQRFVRRRLDAVQTQREVCWQQAQNLLDLVLAVGAHPNLE